MGQSSISAVRCLHPDKSLKTRIDVGGNPIYIVYCNADEHEISLCMQDGATDVWTKIDAYSLEPKIKERQIRLASAGLLIECDKASAEYLHLQNGWFANAEKILDDGETYHGKYYVASEATVAAIYRQAHETQVRLFRLARRSIRGQISNWVVSSVEVDNGFQTTKIAFDYAPDPALAEAGLPSYEEAAERAIFNSVTTIPDNDRARFGATQSYHFNGRGMPANAVLRGNAAAYPAQIAGSEYRTVTWRAGDDKTPELESDDIYNVYAFPLDTTRPTAVRQFESQASTDGEGRASNRTEYDMSVSGLPVRSMHFSCGLSELDSATNLPPLDVEWTEDLPTYAWQVLGLCSEVPGEARIRHNGAIETRSTQSGDGWPRAATGAPR